jgi:hypothetical protein
MSEVTELAPDAEAAWRLARQGDFAGAIDAAVPVLQHTRDMALLRAIIDWRRHAFTQVTHPPGPATWPPALPDPFPGHVGIPAICVTELTAAVLGGAILHHGSLRVNGLVDPSEADALRTGIDRALAARDDHYAARPAADPGWYTQVDVPTLDHSREWMESTGAVWTADCPPMLFAVIDAFNRCGAIDCIAELMQQRPALSIGKSTLRRVPAGSDTDWHQDGAFLGRDVRSVNIWLALSACGVDAPGLDVVSRRLPYIVQTGSHGACFDWSVGPGMIELLEEGGAQVESPEFAPGDALLFDHMMLHRTGRSDGMTRPRWAIESWFFAPSHYPPAQVPLLD